MQQSHGPMVDLIFLRVDIITGEIMTPFNRINKKGDHHSPQVYVMTYDHSCTSQGQYYNG